MYTRYLRGLTPVSKRINTSVRLKDPRVTVCPPGREIESPPFVVLRKRFGISSNAWVRAVQTSGHANSRHVKLKLGDLDEMSMNPPWPKIQAALPAPPPLPCRTESFGSFLTRVPNPDALTMIQR